MTRNRRNSGRGKSSTPASVVGWWVTARNIGVLLLVVGAVGLVLIKAGRPVAYQAYLNADWSR